MLTDAECREATCPPDKARARFTDVAGLYLEISPAGSKQGCQRLHQRLHPRAASGRPRWH